ncbi:MAG: Glycosyltransferase, group 4 family [Berkelbacteria bacterium GW2011_GWB1_38_5]|uniref:Glycosyltransferase, group 4 family n=1 Tax=Berkelbacteria bacterium GW2011_GWB1_38_5 TaxID=1618336 RepID=A0A0G0K4Y4_9BACT|nr:MAG: Glycosyltransferase, group 4 family [Berkelbacteria bacterium GW2011_GWB1_38_5]
MIRAYLPAFVISALICGGLTYYVRRLAQKLKLFDQPSPRKIPPYPLPRLGGVAIVATFLIVTIGYIFASRRLNFGENLWFADQKLIGVILGLIVLIVLGILDDIRGVGPLKKLFWQLVACVIVVSFGVSIGFLRLPFGSHLDLTNPQIHFALFGHGFNIEVLADLISIFWILLLINTFNFLDGLDGLATGISLISAIVIFFLSISLGQDASALLAVIIAGTAAGFLPWNFNPARIFLGDSGSMALGYLIGVLAMISGGKLATSFLVLGIPVLDVGWVVLRRIFKGKSPFLADKRHLHHRLLTAGLTQKQSVILLYIISMIFGTVAIISKTQEKITALIVLICLMIVLALALVVLELRKRARQNG